MCLITRNIYYPYVVLLVNNYLNLGQCSHAHSRVLIEPVQVVQGPQELCYHRQPLSCVSRCQSLSVCNTVVGHCHWTDLKIQYNS